MTRRPDGALEADVLHALWDLGEPSSPSDVIKFTKTELAYTSIATILRRLCDKGLVTRHRLGRAFLYSPASTEAELTASRIRSVLDAATDREAALAGFADALDPGDAARLAEILRELS